MGTPTQMDIKIEDEEFVCPDPPSSQDTKDSAKDYYSISEFNTNRFDFDGSADDDDEEHECTLCEKVFQSKKLFKVHLKQHGKLDGWLSDSGEEEEFQSIEKPETETMDLQSIALNKKKSKVDKEIQIDEKSERYHVNDGAKSQSLNSLMQVKPAEESRDQSEEYRAERKRALARERSRRRYLKKKSLSISKSGLLAATETPSQEVDEEYQYRAERRRALARERTRRCRNKKSLSVSKSGLLAANETQIPGPSQVEEANNIEKLRKNILRDPSNPLELHTESAFIAQYRLNKGAFCMLLEAVESHFRRQSISPIIQLAATLRFLGTGNFQKTVIKDLQISLDRPTVSFFLNDVINVLERVVCPRWIKLPMDSDEKSKAMEYFYTQHKIPGITGCIDGTLIKIVKPRGNEHLYLSRKGYYSMKIMIICDHDMKIRAIDSQYPGSSHDAFVWIVSNARRYFLQQYESGDRTCRLLGDDGYVIEPFLITPYRDPQHGSKEYKFNIAHSSARSIVDRTIGGLKSRFRCLLNTMHYEPEKVSRIINVCSALHNICRSYNVEDTENRHFLPESPEDSIELAPNTNLQSDGRKIRDEIANGFL